MEIHECRRSRQKLMLQFPREPGVGAESDSLCSSISDVNIGECILGSSISDVNIGECILGSSISDVNVGECILGSSISDVNIGECIL